MSVVYVLSGTTWTAPGDWPGSGKIECIGGGGASQSWNNSAGNYATPGGGGAYSAKNTLTVATGVALAVGLGGTTTGASGGDTWFNGASLAASSCGAHGGQGGQDSAAGAGGSTTGGIGDTKNAGGAGGTYNGATVGADGGGGAGGPFGAGGTGGQQATSGGGGGGGGAASGNTGGNGSAGSGGAGGNNHLGAGSGAGGIGAGPTAAVAGTAGGGGGGGATNGSSDACVSGANGGTGTEWDATHGAGGGGGGSASASLSSTSSPGNGGLYGGGGGGVGGSGSSNGDAIGTGAHGIIVITYTPAALGSYGDGSSSGATSAATGTNGQAMQAIVAGNQLDVIVHITNSTVPTAMTISDGHNTYNAGAGQFGSIDVFNDSGNGQIWYRFRCSVTVPLTTPVITATAQAGYFPTNMSIFAGVLTGISLSAPAPFTSGNVAHSSVISGLNQISGNTPTLTTGPGINFTLSAFAMDVGASFPVAAPAPGAGFTQIATAWAFISSGGTTPTLLWETQQLLVGGSPAQATAIYGSGRPYTLLAVFNNPALPVFPSGPMPRQLYIMP